MGASKRDQDAFIDRFADIAMEISKQTGVRPEVVLGQTAFETGWGKSVAGNNMFGIKGQGQMVKTKEDYGFGKFSTVESFRAYNDPVESFRDYGDLTLRGKSLSDIVAPGMTAREQVAALKAAGYATDKDYVKNLSATVHSIQRNPAFQNAAVSYATSTIPTASVDLFADVGIPLGQVTASAIPDLTPAPEAGFSFRDFDIGSATLPADFSMDFSQYDATPDFSSITAGTAFDPLTNISPSAPAAPNFSDVELNTYPDISAGMYASPMDSFTPVDAAPVNLSDIPTGPQPSGFSAGLGEGPWGATPDFSAPSLEARNAMDRFNGAMQVRNTTAPDLTNEAIAQSLMSQFGPQTPQAPIAPAPVSAPPSVASTSPMGDIGFDEFGSNFPAASAPAPQRAAPSLPSVNLPSAPQVQAPASLPETAPLPPTRPQEKGLFSGLPDLGLPDLPGLGDIGGFFGASPQTQTALNGWAGGAIKGAALGGLTGGPIGAVMGGVFGAADPFGRVTNSLGNAFGGWLDGRGFDLGFGPMATWDTWDPATYGFGPGFNERGERSHTGRDESGNATVGDGSYAESSGRNDNNPQGIL